MAYLLDTDTCIFLLNRKRGYEAILRRLDGLRYGEVLLSAITLAELRHGIAKSTRKEQELPRLERVLARFDARDFDEGAAQAYGPIRAELERKGTPIGPLDTLIAAHAVSLNAILVTNNEGEFSRVPNLRLENWFTDPAP
jgi:tRNA(fMet)-specific endonuclease VapC